MGLYPVFSGSFVGNEESDGMGGYRGVEEYAGVAITGDWILVMEQMGGKYGSSTE
jgi:hypothetical protein